MTSRTWILALSVAALVAAVALFVVAQPVPVNMFDLHVYRGSTLWWLSGGDLYDYHEGDTAYGFTYPPLAALVMLPMSVLPWQLLAVLHTWVNLVAGALVLGLLVEPRPRTPRWFPVAVACCLVAMLDPVRVHLGLGQLNLVLLALVVLDLTWLAARYPALAGVGIGLATAVKLTPALFIVYLLVLRRWRAAATAGCVAAGLTAFAVLLAPEASRVYWTSALWDVGRLGRVDFESNQSLWGMVNRLDPLHPNRPLWLGLCAAVLAVWLWRLRAVRRDGDVLAGLALTGVVACLISPVTWVHHLVWLIPALVLLVDRGRPAIAAAAGGVLAGRVVWSAASMHDPLAWFAGVNAYLWVTLVLLVTVPVEPPLLAPQLSGSARRSAAGADPVRESAARR